MRKKNRKRKNQERIRSTILTIMCFSILFILVIVGAYFIFSTDLLEPKVNKVTASYISLNNKDKTDILKISNLKKMSNKDGINSKDNYLNLVITGDLEKEYKIVIYPINNNIDYKYINYSIEKGNKLIVNSLGKIDDNIDGGKTIYSGKLNKNDKIELHMWISRNYTEKVAYNSFEVRIK